MGALEEVVTVETLPHKKVKELMIGDNVLLTGDVEVKIKQTKKSQDYVSLSLVDNTGVVYINVWDNSPYFEELKVYHEQEIYAQLEVVCTKVGEFINADIKALKLVEKPYVEIVDIEAMKIELRQEIGRIKDKDLKALVISFFHRDDVKDSFFTAPASQLAGYSFRGGLLAHTLRKIHISHSISIIFNEWKHNKDGFVAKLNEDLLVTASILDDMGKLYTLVPKAQKIEKSAEGELFEDSLLSMKMLWEELAKSSMPEKQKQILEHIIGASKGKTQFGALHIPRSREAVAYHMIDYLDSQMAGFENLERNASANQEFVQLFQKIYFLGSFDGE